MKEDQLKELLKNSTLKTSNSFSSSVIDGIEKREELVRSFRSKINVLYLMIFSTLVLGFFVKFPTLNYSEFSITIPPIILSISISFFLLFEIRKVNQLRELLFKG